MQNQKLLKTLNFGLFEIDFWSTSELSNVIRKLKYFLWYHKECIINLIKGKKYQTINGEIFIYRDYVVRYLAGSPGSKGIKVNLDYWRGNKTIHVNGPFHGFFDYSIGRWVTNKRELNNRFAQGKIFASNEEIAQEAKYRREQISKESQKQIKEDARQEVHKHFKDWRNSFNKDRAKDTYNALLAANRRAQTAKYDEVLGMGLKD